MTLKELCGSKWDNCPFDGAADSMGISRSDAKKLAKEVESICSELKKAKVTAGYELELTIKVKGSELDEPEEEELTICVYKINGRWFLDVISLVEGIGGIGGLLPF